MTLFPGRELLKRRADTGLIIAFLIFLCLPAADSFLHLDPAPTPNENRRPAAFPPFAFTLNGAREFVAGIENYFNDHFGFRHQLVRWEQRWKWKFFRDSRTSDVLVGKTGWLFYSDGRMVDDVSGTRPFSEAALAEWHTLLTGRRDWLRQRGIRYLFVVPPDKHSIYPEHLPDWLTARARPPRRLDQFMDYMRAQGDVPVLDLREALLEAKQQGDVYLHTDTHWNDRGALAAYRRITRALASLGVPATPPGAAAFRETVADAPGGDLARMLGQEKYLAEKGRYMLAPQSSAPPIETRADLIAKQWIPATEPQLSVNPGANGKIVMFRDSFATDLQKFFACGFNRAVYFWQQNWDREFIEKEKPDIVIDEITERFLIFRDPVELRKNDGHPELQVFGDR